MSRFLRENSQIIASILITGYTGLSVMYRIHKGEIHRDDYEFRTKKNTYLGLSLKDNEFAKKFTFRLSDYERNFDFFRSNTLDFVSFGFNKLRQGAHIGLPLSYFANSKSDIPELISHNGFHNFMGHSITPQELNKKLDKDQLDRFYDSLILSQDAKLFGLGREMAYTDNFIKANLDRVIEFVSLSGAYVYSFAKTRAYKLQLLQRRRVYAISSFFALSLIIGSKLLTKKVMDESVDYSACQMGLDCCEGSIEYYDKMLERNKLLRYVLPEGDKIIDENGNLMKQPVRIPFTNSYFYMNNIGVKLSDRKEYCRKQLGEMVKNLSDKLEKENSESCKRTDESTDESSNESKDDKELKIFKALRLKLENLVHSK